MSKRSNSSSHIPLPSKIEPRVRARSSGRTSSTDERASTKKTRALSTDRVFGQGYKKSSLFNTYKTTPTMGHSTTKYNVKKLSGLTPKIGLGTTPKMCLGTTPTVSGHKRPTSSMSVPRSIRSQSKSPHKGGQRDVNDKKWVAEQYAKVCRYLQEHPDCESHVPTMIKPPTTNTFVYVMNLLFKEIDPTVEFNTVNYKDVLVKILKTLNYPGQITNSLMKTVSTMHAWPQIISIFSWLVDVNTSIQRLNMPVNPILAEDPKYKQVELITDYIIDKYVVYNNDDNQAEADERFGQKFVEIMNINEQEIQQLEQEVTELFKKKEEQCQKIKKQNNINDEVKKQTEDLLNEVDTFYLSKEEREKDITYAVDHETAVRDKLKDLIKIKRINIAGLKETVSKQPCTLEEKKKMSNHIEEMKHRIDLKKEQIKTQNSLRNVYDVHLSEAKKKVETEVYRLNNSLMELAITEPQLKVLQLGDTNFESMEFGDEIKLLAKNIELLKNKFSEEISAKKLSTAKLETEVSSLKQQIEHSKETLQSLTENENAIKSEIQRCEEKMKNIIDTMQSQKNIFDRKISELKKTMPNVDEVKKRLRNIEELKNKEQIEFEQKMKQSLEFFEKLHDVTVGNLTQMNNIRTEVFEMLTNCLEKAVQFQEEITEDLHQLDEIKN